MPILALTAALGASLCWAVGSLIAHRPATQLGAFEFTRTQLISSSALLVVVVTALNGWQSVAWTYWPSFVVASLVGVIVTNLAIDRLPEAWRAATHAAAGEHERSDRRAAGILVPWGLDVAAEAA